jgi:glycosyl hydrolase, family 2, putative
MDALAEKIRELTEQGLAAAVYTQLTDVEEESNGILTYDRKVCKWEPQEAKDFCPKE